MAIFSSFSSSTDNMGVKIIETFLSFALPFTFLSFLPLLQAWRYSILVLNCTRACIPAGSIAAGYSGLTIPCGFLCEHRQSSSISIIKEVPDAFLEGTTRLFLFSIL